MTYLNIQRPIFVFVIGAPRSGTTWLHKMIADHGDICSLEGSNTFLQKYILPFESIYTREKQTFYDKGFTRGLPSKLDWSELEKLVGAYIGLFYDNFAVGESYYVEKATDLTAYIHRIKFYIPNAKFIHIVRDGRNQTLSEMKLRHKYGSPFGIDSIHNGARRWKQQVQEVHQNADGFKQDLYEVKYEDMLVNTPHYLTEIFRFIGCEVDSSIVEGISAKFDYRNKPVSMPTTPIKGASGQATQIFESEMTRSQQIVFEHYAGDLLHEMGYPVKYYNKTGVGWSFIRKGHLFVYFFRHLFLASFYRKISRVHRNVRKVLRAFVSVLEKNEFIW